ncbi:MAG: NADH-quinone oxidoreductase subunit NuoH [Cytophagales bacterium]|nr:NADH-quinone oxidoreductase subunit NuoH [Bernardetiaceae bacterium]MDW8211612.1 NADH-quinone oxidoreductase subunit NuoH [Cytophagales bacterium]
MMVAGSLFVFFLGFLLLYTVFAVYAERKIAAFIQDRLGPMETGRYGLLQTIADLLKMLQKEDITPQQADKVLFRAAPFVIFAAVFSGFCFIPLVPQAIASTSATGIFALLAIVSLDVMGILMAGWGSNNKFSLIGAMRSVAQIVSYEIPLGLAVLCVAICTGTLNLQQMAWQQSIFYTPDDYGSGFFQWNVVRYPLLVPVFLIFFIASLAECNRAPFDLPEAESELVAGYQTEYAGFRWAVLMLGEYGMMLLVSMLSAVMFFGAWSTPLPNFGPLQLARWTSGTIGHFSSWVWGSFWLLSKTLLLVGLQMWVRWTYPRLRIDQLMALCWKYLTPAGLLLVFLCSIAKLL